MAVPTTYTEAEFAAYLHSQLGAVASSLGWTVGAGSYDEAINDALIMLGLTEIASVSGLANVAKLRPLGLLAVWRRVVAETSGDCDFSADNASYSRSQVNDMARKHVGDLESQTAGYRSDAAAVNFQRTDYPHDPYGDTLLIDRTL